MGNTTANIHINEVLNNTADGKEAITASNYTDEDALAFAELSYVKFENVTAVQHTEDLSAKQLASAQEEHASGAIKDGMSLQEYCYTMEKYTDDEAKKALLRGIENNPRYENCTIGNFDARLSDTEQWAAITIDFGDNSNTSVIAFRGTDGTTIGWSEDFELAYSMGTDAQLSSNRYLTDYLTNHEDANVYLAGHSKGGNDSIYAYTTLGEELRNRVLQVNNFDGPGLMPEVLGKYSDAYYELQDKLIVYAPEDSVIGMLLCDHFQVNYVKNDSESFMWEHDAQTWLIGDDGKLIRTQQSDISKMINKTLDETILSCNADERKNIVDVLDALGIPATIAKRDFLTEDEKARLDFAHSIDYAMESNKIGHLGMGGTPDYAVLTGDKKGLLESITYASIMIDRYNNLSPDQKETMIKVVSTAYFTILYEDYLKPIREKADEMKTTFNTVINTMEMAMNGTSTSSACIMLLEGIRSIGNQILDGVKSLTTLGTGSSKVYAKDVINVNYGILDNVVSNLKSTQRLIRGLDSKLDDLYDCLYSWELIDKGTVAGTDFGMTGSSTIQNIATNLFNSGSDWEVTACSNYLSAVVSQLKEKERLLNTKASQLK